MPEQDIREMLLQKIGPLGGKLLREDQDRRLDQPLFHLPLDSAADLDRGEVPLVLQDRLREQSLALWPSPRVSQTARGRRWQIADADCGDILTIERGLDRLDVHGDRIVNPFIQEITRRANGVPLYVKYIVGDILAGRIRDFKDLGALPAGLVEYHDKLLKRCQVGRLGAIVTPSVTLLAVANEPLSVEHLLERLVDGHLYVDNARAREDVRHGLAAVESMIRQARTPCGTLGYTIYHHSLR